jgi:hypothetical protein
MNAARPSHLAYSVVGDRYTFLLTGADTEGMRSSSFMFQQPAVRRRTSTSARTRPSTSSMASSSSLWPENRCASRRAAQFQEHRRDIRPDGRDRGAAGLEDFPSEIGSRLASRDAAPTPLTPEDIQKLLRTAPRLAAGFRALKLLANLLARRGGRPSLSRPRELGRRRTTRGQ